MCIQGFELQVEQGKRVGEAIMAAGMMPVARLSDSGSGRDLRVAALSSIHYSTVLSPASLPSYIVLMNPLRRPLAFTIRTPRSYDRPYVSSVRWSSSGPQTISKILPTFSLQGKVSNVILLFLPNAETSSLSNDRFAS